MKKFLGAVVVMLISYSLVFGQGHTGGGGVGGASFPLTSPTTHPAASGQLRLANNTDKVCWRNAANSADICIYVDSSNVFQIPVAITTPSVNTNGLNNGFSNCAAGSSSFEVLIASTLQFSCPDTQTAVQRIYDGTAPTTATVLTYGAPVQGAVTYNATPTSGGSGFVSGDQGLTFTLVCGATGTITTVATGAVTVIATQPTKSGSGCTTGTGKSTTCALCNGGGGNSTLTVNLTAIGPIIQESLSTALPVGLTASISALGVITWNNAGNCVFSASGANPLGAGGHVTTVSGQSCTLLPDHQTTWGTYILKIINASSTAATFTLGTGGIGGCTAWKVGGGGAGAVTLSGAGATDLLIWTLDDLGNCDANFRTNFN